jgi:hypothetical protein
VREALAAEVRNFRALNTLGGLPRATAKFDEALEAYEAAVAVNRNDPNAQGQIGCLKMTLVSPRKPCRTSNRRSGSAHWTRSARSGSPLRG